MPPAVHHGGLLAGSVLWGWLLVTYCSGIARCTPCRTLSVEVKSVYNLMEETVVI